MKRFLHILMAVLVFTNILTTNQTVCLADNEALLERTVGVYAETAVLIEAETGTILYDKNCHKEMYPASITKIMTALLTLENCSLTDEVEFSENAINSLELGDAHIALVPGEVLSVEECLYALMLASANEVAIGLAEHISGSVESFADLMNERAKQAGALNTHFANPNGLHDENHYTSAYDMAMITRDAINTSIFTTITDTTSYVIGKTNKTNEKRYVSQRHKMVWENGAYYYEGCTGGKTGYTDQAGTTLVTFATRNNMTLISVVLNTNGANVYSDTATLLDYGFNNFYIEKIAENETIASGLEDDTPNLSSQFSQNDYSLLVKEDDYVVMPNDVKFSDLDKELSFDTGDTADNTLAVLQYFYKDKPVGSGTIIYENYVEASGDVSRYTYDTVSSLLEGESESQEETTTTKKFTIPSWFFPVLILFIAITGVAIVFKCRLNYINRIRMEKRRRNR